MKRKLTMGMLAAIACGGGGGGDAGDTAVSADSGTHGSASTSGDDAEGSATAPGDDTNETTASNDGEESTDATSAGDDGSSTGDDTADETTAGTAECAAPVTASVCGNPNSIVRGTATLAVADGPTAGNVLVLLNHEYLGGGADGGVPHTGVFYTDVELADGPFPFEIDMCSNGEMWSEENCEFVVHVTLDLDGDNAIDPGEPTGSASLFLSCTGDAVCLDVALDCVDGLSCVSFADPPLCGCVGNGASCNSPIVAC